MRPQRPVNATPGFLPAQYIHHRHWEARGSIYELSRQPYRRQEWSESEFISSDVYVWTAFREDEEEDTLYAHTRHAAAAWFFELARCMGLHFHFI